MGQLRRIFLLLLASLILTVPVVARHRRQGAATLVVELPASYEKAVAVVAKVAEDSLIHGTAQYEGDNQLPGASSASSSSVFASYNGEGRVFYKVRLKALAPSHFIDSKDMGVVSVRYIVEPAGPNTSKLMVDATFVEDSHHGQHPSDGSVETSELGEIGEQLKLAELQEKEDQRQLDANAQKRKLQELRKTIKDEQALVDSLAATLQRLQDRVAAVRGGGPARVTSVVAELKVAPYSRAGTIQRLSKNAEVRIVSDSPYWYLVQTPEGRQGWVYHLFLKPVL